MTYFYISGGAGKCPEVPECPPMPDLSPVEAAIVERGGTVDKASEDITAAELVAAIATIPEGVEPEDLTGIAQAIRNKGGTVAEGHVTVEDLIAAVATIPEPGVAPECPMPGVPIGPTIKEIVVFPPFLTLMENISTELKDIPEPEPEV